MFSLRQQDRYGDGYHADSDRYGGPPPPGRGRSGGGGGFPPSDGGVSASGTGGTPPPGMFQQGAVLMVYGLDMDKVNCNRLFNLLCLYGNVVRVSSYDEYHVTCWFAGTTVDCSFVWLVYYVRNI